MKSRKMEEYLAEFGDDEKELAQEVSKLMASTVAFIGTQTAPTIVAPGQNPRSHEAVLARGTGLLTAWRSHIRQAITHHPPELAEAFSPSVTAMICGMILGETYGAAIAAGEKVDPKAMEKIVDVFEGGFLLGRVNIAQGLDEKILEVVRDDKTGTLVVKNAMKKELVH